MLLRKKTIDIPLRETEKWPGGIPVSFGNNVLDELSGGVYPGQLTVLHGEKICKKVAEQLCVRSQLPSDLEGEGATSVFIDGGNIFDVYQISNYANAIHLDRDKVLRQIKVSRAFTCYQLVNLIVEKLPELLCEENVRLVVIASIISMFMDPDVDLNEAKQSINFLSGFLVRLARQNNVAIVATCPLSMDYREAFLRQFLTGRAQVVLKAERSGHQGSFVLEKHPVKSWPRRISATYPQRKTGQLVLDAELKTRHSLRCIAE